MRCGQSDQVVWCDRSDQVWQLAEARSGRGDERKFIVFAKKKNSIPPPRASGDELAVKSRVDAPVNHQVSMYVEEMVFQTVDDHLRQVVGLYFGYLQVRGEMRPKRRV